jgi:hypothetical protein
MKFGSMSRWTHEDLDGFLQNAAERRGEKGLKPKGIRRGRKPWQPGPTK